MAGNLALYRKYRSATFAEVIGQEHVTEPLSQALKAGRINHAYLFSGPRGCGKTSSARILARSLNCANGPTPDPCGVCDSCVELAPNGSGSIDVIEIDAASHGGVDDARDLRERAFFAPVRDRYKVYIIDEAHMVTTQGFNALLKLVEEPPDFLVFVFATTEPEKVLTTIRSRTHHYPFRLIPRGIMRAHLEAICTSEEIIVEQAVLALVVRAGGGSARDSLSILDQLLAGAGPEGVTYARAVALLGVTDGALLDDMVDALAAGDAAGVYGTVDRIVEAGHDPRRFAADLLDRFRDLILLDAVPDAGTRGLIDAPQDQLAQMGGQAARIGVATLTRYAEIVHTALLEMRGTTSPRLVLELLCARMQLPDASADAAALLQRVERLERRNSALAETAAHSASAAPSASGAPEAASAREPRAAAVAALSVEAPIANIQAEGSPDRRPPASSSGRVTPPPRPKQAPARPERAPWPTPPSPASAPVVSQPSVTVAQQSPVAPDQPASATPSGLAGQLDAAALRRLWPDVLDVVKLSSRRTRALLETAQITTAVGELITLSAPDKLAKMLADDSNTSVLRAALTSVVGGSWQIDVQRADEPEVGDPSAAGQARSGPSGQGQARSATTRRGAARSGPTRPAEPDPRDDTDFDSQAAPTAAVDPEAEALRLLHDQLGARPLDEQ